MLFTSWRFLHSINTESLHRRAGKPRLSRHSEWEILQNGSRALFYISPAPPPVSLVSSPPFTPPFISRRRDTLVLSDDAETVHVRAYRRFAVADDGGGGGGIVVVVVVVADVDVDTTRSARSVARPCNYRSGNPRFRSSSVLLRRRRRHHLHHHHYRHHYHLPPVTAAAAAVATTVTTTSAISRETIFVYTRFYMYIVIQRCRFVFNRAY